MTQFFQLDTMTSGWSGKVVNSPEFQSVKARIAKEIKGVKVTPSFYELLIRETADLLEIEGADLLVWGWKKRREIIKYRDTKKYPPAKVYLVPLLEHSLTSKHASTVEAVYNGKSIARVKFDITLKLNLDGAILKIKNARIEEIKYGSCTGAGNIAYSGVKILEKETAPFDLPATYKPAQPIQI
jgi:hypothetical protein